MSLTIDFAPQVEAWLNEQAKQQGIPPAEVVRKLVGEHVPASRFPKPFVFPPTGRAVKYLLERLETEASDDPVLIQEAQDELDELKRRLNEERDLAGAEHVF